MSTYFEKITTPWPLQGRGGQPKRSARPLFQSFFFTPSLREASSALTISKSNFRLVPIDCFKLLAFDWPTFKLLAWRRRNCGLLPCEFYFQANSFRIFQVHLLDNPVHDQTSSSGYGWPCHITSFYFWNCLVFTMIPKPHAFGLLKSGGTLCTFSISIRTCSAKLQVSIVGQSFSKHLLKL